MEGHEALPQLPMYKLVFTLMPFAVKKALWGNVPRIKERVEAS